MRSWKTIEASTSREDEEGNRRPINPSISIPMACVRLENAGYEVISILDHAGMIYVTGAKKEYFDQICRNCAKSYDQEDEDSRRTHESGRCLESEEKIDKTLGDSPLSGKEHYPLNAIVDLLGLVSISVTPEQVSEWTDEQRDQVCKWAGAVYTGASDNDNIVVPPKPDFLPPVQQWGDT